jgi:Fur family ferric uptake transcriptional regulator
VSGEVAEAERVFREFLAGRGLRLSAPRRAVLRAAMALEQHFGRRQLERRLAASGVHRATIFRTLPLLVEAGIVARVREARGRVRFEHVLGHGHHDHLLCERCGRVLEFESPAVEREQERLCRKHGFRQTSHSFVVRGLCSECRARQARQAGSGRGSE